MAAFIGVGTSRGGLKGNGGVRGVGDIGKKPKVQEIKAKF